MQKRKTLKAKTIIERKNYNSIITKTGVETGF